VQVGADSDWRAVAAGGAHVLAVKTDGSLWSWGQNHEGQLGHGTTSGRGVPTRDGTVGDGTTVARTAPVQVGTRTDWLSADVGGRAVVAVRADGTLWGWGSNQGGRLGDPALAYRTTPLQLGAGRAWTSARAGDTHVTALFD
jgi:alpha-tubulin suppressor-like RCC1 family protein